MLSAEIKDNSREINMDLLRTLIMCGIISLHILGGVDKTATMSEGWLIDFINTSAYSTVDIFALLIGYFGINSKTSSVVYRSFQTFFVCLVVCIVGLSIGCIPGRKEFFEYLFPFLDSRLWFVWSYIIVFLISPYLNYLVLNLKRKKIKTMILLMISLLGTGTTLANADYSGSIGTGYSALWLILLYLMGAYIKINDVKLKIKPLLAIGIICFNTVVTLESKYIIAKVPLLFWTPNFLYKYISPFMVVNAFLSLLLFKDFVSVSNSILQRIIIWTSSVSFGVYIIHANPLVLDKLLYQSDWWKDFLVGNGIIECLFRIALSVVGIYLICGSLEQVRRIIFDFTGVTGMCKSIDQRLLNVISIETRKA